MWNRRALVYTRCRTSTGKGNQLRWKKILGPGLEDTICAHAGGVEEQKRLRPM